MQRWNLISNFISICLCNVLPEKKKCCNYRHLKSVVACIVMVNTSYRQGVWRSLHLYALKQVCYFNYYTFIEDFGRNPFTNLAFFLNYLAGNPEGIKVHKVYFLLIYLQLKYNIRLESHCLPTHHLLFYIFYGL